MSTTTSNAPGAAGIATVTMPPRFLTFATVWFGQFVSLIGTELSAFTLGLWAFRQTGSASWFTLIVFFANLPLVVLMPFAGALVDRWDRRRTMIASNLVSAAVMSGLMFLALSGRLRLWQIYPAVGLTAAANAFHWPAYASMPALAVPKKHLGRAAGMIELARAGSQSLAPLLSGILVAAFALTGVIAIDVATFLFAVVSLLLVTVPRPAPKGESAGLRALAMNVKEGWTYITRNQGLVRLLVFFVVFNVFFSGVYVLWVPMIGFFADNKTLGMIASVGTAGMVGGGLLMSTWGGPQKKIHSIVASALLISVCSIVAGFKAWPPLVAVCMFGFYVGFAVINASAQGLWQMKVPIAMQGRVFAMRRMMASATVPLAFFLAGPISDKVFEPRMAPGGALARSAGAMIGVGKGRGVALFVILLGLVMLVQALWGLTSAKLMNLEMEVPDAVAS
jgi:DHA3 family macrolide efflux protein-like MFS transporter